MMKKQLSFLMFLLLFGLLYQQQLFAQKNERTANSLATASVDLQSYPQGLYCIYLDFDGETISGTSWFSGATYTAQPSGYVDGEMRQMWKIVSEDFRPFNVNVTTNRTVFESYAKENRQMVIVTTSDDAAPGNGGIANVSGDRFKDKVLDDPCFVFNLSDLDLTTVSNNASHEVGHTLLLKHDGGPGTYYYTTPDWSPIMGAGGKTAQWNNGDYPGATENQDDVLIIGEALGFKPDLVGNGIENPTPLIVATNGQVDAVSNNGIIEKRTDKDVFSFSTSGGQVILNVKPVEFPIGNLNILAKLYDEQNVLIATSTKYGAVLETDFNLTLPQGRYYVSIDGVGYTHPTNSDYSYSDYGSLGYYEISGSIANAIPNCSAVGWTTTSSYITNNEVQFDNIRYKALQNNSGQQPDLNPSTWLSLGACGLPVNPRLAITSPTNLQTFTIHPFFPVPIQVKVEVNYLETPIDKVHYRIKDYDASGNFTLREFDVTAAPFELSFSHVYSTKTEIEATSYSGTRVSPTAMSTIFIVRAVVHPVVTIHQPFNPSYTYCAGETIQPFTVKADVIKYDVNIERMEFRLIENPGPYQTTTVIDDYTEPYEATFTPTIIPNRSQKSITVTAYYNGNQTDYDLAADYQNFNIKQVALPEPATIAFNPDLTFTWINKSYEDTYKLQFREKGSATFYEVDVPENSISIPGYNGNPAIPSVISNAVYEYRVANPCHGTNTFTSWTSFKTGDCGDHIEPAISLTPSQTVLTCLGKEIHFFYSGTGSGFNDVNWNVNDGNFLDFDNDFYYTFNTAGTYTVRLREYGIHGCPEISRIDIVVSGTTSCNDPCASVPQYQEFTNYTAGAKVKNAGSTYACKPWPYTGWCNSPAWAYGPGTGAYWSDAWTLEASCGPVYNTTGCPEYVANTNYTAGSKVMSNNVSYECKPWPNSGWCSGAAWAYAPGTGSYWTDAWTVSTPCNAKQASNEETNLSTLVCSPNPFSSTATVDLSLATSGQVTVSLYSKTGQLVSTVFEGYLQTGTHQFSLEASLLPADVYLIKCQTDQGVSTKKIIKTE